MSGFSNVLDSPRAPVALVVALIVLLPAAHDLWYRSNHTDDRPIRITTYSQKDSVARLQMAQFVFEMIQRRASAPLVIV